MIDPFDVGNSPVKHAHDIAEAKSQGFQEGVEYVEKNEMADAYERGLEAGNRGQPYHDYYLQECELNKLSKLTIDQFKNEVADLQNKIFVSKTWADETMRRMEDAEQELKDTKAAYSIIRYSQSQDAFDSERLMESIEERKAFALEATKTLREAQTERDAAYAEIERLLMDNQATANMLVTKLEATRRQMQVLVEAIEQRNNQRGTDHCVLCNSYDYKPSTDIIVHKTYCALASYYISIQGQE